jgi:hypothetical protein
VMSYIVRTMYSAVHAEARRLQRFITTQCKQGLQTQLTMPSRCRDKFKIQKDYSRWRHVHALMQHTALRCVQQCSTAYSALQQ